MGVNKNMKFYKIDATVATTDVRSARVALQVERACCARTKLALKTLSVTWDAKRTI